MSKVKFGFADEIITPTDLSTIVLDGYGHRTTPATAVHDDLHAKVMAIESDGEISLVFSVDLIGLNPYLYKLVTNQITAVTGIGRDHISMVFIHTHAAPQAGILAGMPINVDYFAYAGEKMGRAALRAIERLEVCKFRFTVLDAEIESAFNRRGRPFIDRRIKAGVFTDEFGNLRAVLSNAACHAVLNTDFTVSADWLWELNKLSTDEVPYFYFQGRGADIDPIRTGGTIDDMLIKLGRELSVPVEEFARTAKASKISEGRLNVRYGWLKVPMMQMNDCESLREQVKAWEENYLSLPITEWNKHYYLRELEWTRKMLEIAEEGGDFDLTVPMQMITVGNDFAFAFVPFELLTLPGERIEELFKAAGFDPASIFVCGYSNSVNGYLAPPEEFEVGGYEVAGAAHWYMISQTCPESAPAVVNWFAEQIRTL